VVMQHARGNQSRAADWMGLNRNTLRKKLGEHKLLK
jgi:Fis family transcriptional regulator, factor for inversion stimulation protein